MLYHMVCICLGKRDRRTVGNDLRSCTGKRRMRTSEIPVVFHVNHGLFILLFLATFPVQSQK